MQSIPVSCHSFAQNNLQLLEAFNHKWHYNSSIMHNGFMNNSWLLISPALCVWLRIGCSLGHMLHTHTRDFYRFEIKQFMFAMSMTFSSFDNKFITRNFSLSPVFLIACPFVIFLFTRAKANRSRIHRRGHGKERETKTRKENRLYLHKA